MGAAKVLSTIAGAITLYIAMVYIAKSSDNQCQMTFMMEPPRFIPVPIDKPDAHLKVDQSNGNAKSDSNQYTLYMYTEYGFPAMSDIERDLKDSMPVLFVPGNAGSHQQVRSLASTCLRRQIQSLDAFKFIFYTIDFNAQLSGISGRLINKQIHFLNLALEQISKRHSSETNGVIVIGHSVGGFIAKALIARRNSEHNLVPLLISLASPLTKSFVNFDDEMRQLFEDTNARWSNKSTQSKPLTLSISGGEWDRLVPMHLSLDPQSDLSLTTSSIKDVWLTADHVSITWCRELMQKLASLLSAVMDKRHIRVIDDRRQAIEVIKSELMTRGLTYTKVPDAQVQRGQRLINARTVETFVISQAFKRNELLAANRLLNLTSVTSGDLFIWLEHIETLDKTDLYVCEDVQLSDNKLFCTGRIDLLALAQTVPSRRFEPRRKIILLQNVSQRFKYLGVEFVSASIKRNNPVPESIVLQLIKSRDTQILNIPSLPQYLAFKLLSPKSLVSDIIVPKRLSPTYARIQIGNFNQLHQYYSLHIETESCKSGDKPGETVVSLLHGSILSESFHPDKTTLTVIAKLSPRRAILANFHDKTAPKATTLELFLDGTCDNSIRLAFDWWSFLEDTIQQRSAEILTSASYLIYASIVSQLLGSSGGNRPPPPQGAINLLEWAWWSTGFAFAYIASASNLWHTTHLTDHVLILASVFTLAFGLSKEIDLCMKATVNLGAIIFRLLGSARAKLATLSGRTTKTETQARSGSAAAFRLLRVDVDWLLIILIVFAGAIFSEVLLRIGMILVILMQQLRLKSSNNDNAKAKKPSPTGNEGSDLGKESLLTSVASLCVLSLVANMPALILMLNSLDIGTAENLTKPSFGASVASFILIKIICDQLENPAHQPSRPLETRPSGRYALLRLLALTPRHGHLLALVPISRVARNICNTGLVELVTLFWTASILIRRNAAAIEAKRKVE